MGVYLNLIAQTNSNGNNVVVYVYNKNQVHIYIQQVFYQMSIAN